MKKFTIIAVLMLFFLSAHNSFGQFTTGQKVLGGRVSAGYSKLKDTSAAGYNNNTFSFGISPGFGKFSNEKTLVEFSLGVGYGNNKYKSINDTSKNSSFNVNAGYTLTKLYPIASKVFFTLGYGGDISYSNSTLDNSNNSASEKSNAYGINFGITPGILIPVRNNKMLLRTGFYDLASISYGFSKNTRTNFDGTKNNTTSQNAGLYFGGSQNFFNGLFVGLSWLLK